MNWALEALWTADWPLVAFGLVVVGFLPVKKPLVSRGISLAVSFLWLGLALVTLSRSPAGNLWTTVWALLAWLEALAFLMFGVLSERLRFGARNGPWTLVGTALALYTLVAFPLLRHFEILPEPSVFGAPFPLVLFTFAILFFAVDTVDRIASLALGVPLLWAFFAGP
ncbi:MAG TPA: DUF6064 family protein, partial [Thermoanaerobaculia bacterium]